MDIIRRCRLRFLVGLAIGPFCVSSAEAHLVSTGIGPFYDGIGHFFLSPDDLIPAVALAMLAGQRGPSVGGWALWTLPAAWGVGGMIGLFSGIPLFSGEICSSSSFIVLGGLVAADLALKTSTVTFLS